MKQQSDQTKKYKRNYLLLLSFNLLLTIVPIIVLVFVALKGGGSEGSTLPPFIIGAITVFIIGFIHFLSKSPFSSYGWVFFIVGYAAFKISADSTLIHCVLAMAICNVLSDILFLPAIKYNKERYNINKEIDKR